MTPFKLRSNNGRPSFPNLEADFMEEECDSLESPPSATRAVRPTTRNRLFDDSCDDDSDAFSFMQEDRSTNTSKTPTRGSFGGGRKLVKPLNLSFDNGDESSDDDDGMSLSLQRRKRLEKLAESGRRDGQSHTPKRAYDDGTTDMISSPYISPSHYMVTIDGRHVQSKNPFSPMVTDETSAGMQNKVVTTNGVAAPSIPVSFEAVSTSRLQKRYARFTRDGYPERDGRYCFTGSPIKEHEPKHINENNNRTEDLPQQVIMSAHKIRRVGGSNDVHNPYNQRRNLSTNLTVDTDLSNNKLDSSFEEVSPTDIFSFPAPPTPQKTRSSGNSPETPIMARSVRRPTMRRTAYHDSTDMESVGTCASYQSEHDGMSAAVSRFKSDFDIIGELGKGSFGAVYKVLSRLDGCMYAIKAALRKSKGNADRERMLKEVYALAALSDQADPATFHIVRYHQAFMEDDRLYIQTELCSSNLADEIANNGGKLEISRRYKLLREMLLALEFIHRNSMCHLDIKPQNIFVKKDPPLDVFKLGDFGLVTKVSYHKDVEEGDSRYMSMELLSGDHQDLTKSDIFSLGCTLYEICLGRELPMNGDEWQAIRAGSLQPLSDTPHEMDVIIKSMLSPSFVTRPSASELLKHPQLLSKEQRELCDARNKVFQAKLALAQQARQFQRPPMPSAGGLVRRNTWTG